jgi:hypothetical protein
VGQEGIEMSHEGVFGQRIGSLLILKIV